MSIDGGRMIDDREPRQARSQHHRANDTHRISKRGWGGAPACFPTSNYCQVIFSSRYFQYPPSEKDEATEAITTADSNVPFI